MKVLVVGGDGVIGANLIRALSRRGDDVVATTRRPAARRDNAIFVDLAASELDAGAMPQADVAIFCAAVTSFAACRQNPDLARRINVTAPKTLARALVAGGARVILLSTSAVFDWTSPNVPADRAPCAGTVYGAQKAEAEAEFFALGSAASVIRFSKVLTPHFNLCTSWIEALRRGEPITAFSDLRMSPISLDDATNAIIAVIDAKASGVYQLSGSHDINYVEAALHIAALLGVAANLVRPARAIDAGIPPEEITTFSSFDDSRLRGITGRPAPDPFAVIDRVFGPSIGAAKLKVN